MYIFYNIAPTVFFGEEAMFVQLGHDYHYGDFYTSECVWMVPGTVED